jgi:hypothetical protein
MTITVYASIGNSDDKLTQRRWSEFADLFVTIIRAHAEQVHGVWYSRPDAPWQNACVCFEIGDDEIPLRMELAHLAVEYEQDSIAWAEVDTTEFIEGAAR